MASVTEEIYDVDADGGEDWIRVLGRIGAAGESSPGPSATPAGDRFRQLIEMASKDWTEFDAARHGSYNASQVRAPLWEPKTSLGKTIMAKMSDGFSVRGMIGLLFEGNRGDLADEMNLKRGISEVQMEATRKDLQAHTQEALKARGLGEEFTVYRAGPPREDIVGVTLNHGTAQTFSAFHGGQTIDAYKIKRSDVLVDLETVDRISWAESELMVPRALLDAQQRKDWTEFDAARARLGDASKMSLKDLTAHMKGEHHWTDAMLKASAESHHGALLELDHRTDHNPGKWVGGTRPTRAAEIAKNLGLHVAPLASHEHRDAAAEAEAARQAALTPKQLAAEKLKQQLAEAAQQKKDEAAAQLEAQEEHKTAVVSDYVEYGYGAVNGYLRGDAGGRYRGASGAVRAAALAEIKDSVRVLDGVVAEGSKLRDNTTLYRGIGPDVFGGGKKFDWGSTVGRSFTDKAFVSTSQSRDAAENIASQGGRGAAVLVVHGLGGIRAARLSDMELTDTSAGEAEVLLPRGLRFTVTSVDPATQDGLPTVHVKVRK